MAFLKIKRSDQVEPSVTMAFLKIKRSDLKFGRELGEGGFGTVYQATLRRSLLKRQEVAVKKLHNIQTREMEILPLLDHPNIIKLYGVVDERPDLFLVMELCEGGSVQEYLNDFKGTRLPFEQFCDWVKQAALPIQYLKEMKIVHKDIKTPNYLITKDGRTLKLGDFGLARKVTSTMSNATSTASYAWMAPELFTDSKLSLNYDIFSFGVVVWEFWTTEYPHRGLEPQVIAWRVCQEKQRLRIPHDCPKPLADFLRLCWDEDWKARPNIDHVAPMIEDVKAAVAAAISKAPQRAAVQKAVTAAVPKPTQRAAVQKAVTAAVPKPTQRAAVQKAVTAAVPKATQRAAAQKAVAAEVPKATKRQILKGAWELEKVIGADGPIKLESPWGIAVNSNADTVAVADAGTGQLQVYSAANLQHRFTLNIRDKIAGGYSHPSSVQVGRDDMYYVTDKRQFVLMFAPTGEYAGKWAAISPQGIPSDAEDTFLQGLTMVMKGQILVGEIDKNYISKHQPGGSHVASIKVDISPRSLAVTSQDTIVISDWIYTVHIVDSQGQLLHQVKRPTYVRSWVPIGVTCIADIICICNNDTKSIHCYSVSGEYLRDFPISLPGEPRCIAFTPDGRHLWVSHYDSPSRGVAVYKLH